MELECGQGGSTGFEFTKQINDNTAAITANTLALIDIETFQFFDYVTDVINDIPETYTMLATLNIPVLEVGTYQINVSGKYNFDTADKDVFLETVLIGGVPDEYILKSEIVGVNGFSLPFLYNHLVEGTFTLILSMRKEDATGVLNVPKVDMWIERKLPTPAS